MPSRTSYRRKRPSYRRKRRPTYRRKKTSRVIVSRRSRPTTSVIPKRMGGQFFADSLHTKCHFIADMQFTTGVSGSVFTFKGNSLYLSGPQTDWTGAFATNVPSGLFYLLSASSGASGAVAPYNFFRIRGSSISVSISPGSTMTIPVAIDIIPSVFASFGASTTRTQYSEQPHAKTKILTFANSRGSGVRMKHYMSTSRMFNLKYKSQIEDNAYTGDNDSDPTRLWYWHVLAHSVDGSGTQLDRMYVRVRVNYYVELFGLNPFVTTAPA